MALSTRRYKPTSRERPPVPNNGKCFRCGGNIYHDYDPQRQHNGFTCGMCGREQPLDSSGRVSTFERKS